MLIGIALLVVFVIFAALMYFNKLPALVALPLMAMLISLAAGIHPKEIASYVIADGASRLNVAIVTVLFGSMLSQFVNRSGIAETLIKKFAELSGDNPFTITIVMTFIVALLFTVLGGLGSVIMVASIVLPILLSIGVPRMVAGCVFLMGVSLGGIFNLTNWQLYMSVLGLKQEQIFGFAVYIGLIMVVTSVVFIWVELKRQGTLMLWAESIEEKPKLVSWYAALTPVIPIVLVMSFTIYNFIAKPAEPFEFPIITAMMIGLAWGFFSTLRKDSINLLSRSVIEGINTVGPAIALIMGIGMVLNSVMHPSVTSAVSPILALILPRNAFYYVIFFFILAPLALYRGPLNIWGMGAGLVALMVTTKTLPAAAVMAALMSVGQIQGVCDPTNTFNVWISNYLNIDVQDILKRTIPYVWTAAVIGLVIAGFKYF